MPSTVSWTGTTDGVVTTAGNYAGGVAPIAGDSVIATSKPANAMASGTLPALVDFKVFPEYGSNSIGVSGTAIGFGNVSGTFQVSALCPLVNVTTSGTIALAKFEMPNNGDCFIDGGTWTDVTVNAGIAFLASSNAIVTTLTPLKGSDCTLLSNGTAVTTVTGSGKLTTSRSCTTVNGDPGGRIITRAAAAVTTINAVGYGIIHQSSGTLGTVNLRDTSFITPQGNILGTATVTTTNEYPQSMVTLATPGAALAIGTRNTKGVPTTSFAPPPSGS